MGKQAEIYAALKESAEALASSMGLAHTIEDLNFTPPYVDGDPQPYLRFDLFMNDLFWQGISDGRIDQGLMQVNLIVPAGYDRATAFGQADEIIEAYPKASILPGARLVKIQSQPWLASPITEDAWTMYPVTVSWTA